MTYVLGDDAEPDFAADGLSDLVPDVTDRDVFLCGPPGFVAAVHQTPSPSAAPTADSSRPLRPLKRTRETSRTGPSRHHSGLGLRPHLPSRTGAGRPRRDGHGGDHADRGGPGRSTGGRRPRRSISETLAKC